MWTAAWVEQFLNGRLSFCIHPSASKHWREQCTVRGQDSFFLHSAQDPDGRNVALFTPNHNNQTAVNMHITLRKSRVACKANKSVNRRNIVVRTIKSRTLIQQSTTSRQRRRYFCKISCSMNSVCSRSSFTSASCCIRSLQTTTNYVSHPRTDSSRRDSSHWFPTQLHVNARHSTRSPDADREGPSHGHS